MNRQMTAKQKNELKKQSLLRFIIYKLEMAGESQEEINEMTDLCKKMSYKALREFAIQNDFVDY